MDVHVVTVSNYGNYDHDCNVKVFKTDLDAEKYIESIYKKYEPRSKEILEEFRKTNKIENIAYFNFPDLDDYITELIDENESDTEIIKSIIETEFVRIRNKKLKLELDNHLILNFDIL